MLNGGTTRFNTTQKGPLIVSVAIEECMRFLLTLAAISTGTMLLTGCIVEETEDQQSSFCTGQS